MNIQFVVSQFPKISETFILNQVAGMIDLGHDIKIFARFRPNEGKKHDIVDEYDLSTKTTYSITPKSKLRRVPSAIKLLLTEGWRQPKKSVRSMNVLRFGRDALSLQLLHTSMSFPNGDPDILHCHFGPNANLGALLKRLDEIQCLVVSFHGSDIQLALNEKRDLYEPVFDTADKILVNSEYNARKLVALGANPSDVTQHPVGVDIEQFPYRWRNTNPADVNKVIILTIGRLVKEKGYPYGLQAVKDLVNHHPDRSFEYRIVGSGNRKNDLKAKRDELGLQEVVRFLGQMTTNEVIEQLGETHIFLLPSIREGFGKVLLEAQATGLPIISTTAGGIPEAVNTNGAGYLAPPADADALANLLDKVVTERNQWDEMGRAGREYVKNNYDTKVLNQRLQELYRDIVD